MDAMSAVPKATVTVHLMPTRMVQWKVPSLDPTSEIRLDWAKASRSAMTKGAKMEIHWAPHSGHRWDLLMVRTSEHVTGSYLVPMKVSLMASGWVHL